MMGTVEYHAVTRPAANPADPLAAPLGCPPAGDLAPALLEAIPSHVAVVDGSGTIIAVSGAWRRFWETNGGGPSTCGVGSNYLAVCDAASPGNPDAAAVATGLRRVIAGELREFFRSYECHAPVQRRWYQMRISRLEWPGPTRVLIVHEAITEIHLVEESQRRRLVEAAHLSRLCLIGRLASELVHELTQPLAAIGNYARGCARRLERAPAPEGVAEAMGLIEAESRRAEAIVQRARGFAARREPVRTPLDLSQIVADAAVLWEETARNRGAEVIVDAPPGIRVMGDAGQLEQVVLNAVFNAIDAANGRPGLRINVSARQHAGVAEVEITDNGPGIAPEVRGSLFQPFVTSRPAGLGMGLVICRSIAQDHGGDVSLADRTDGPGAAFRLTLPSANAELHHGR